MGETLIKLAVYMLLHICFGWLLTDVAKIERFTNEYFIFIGFYTVSLIMVMIITHIFEHSYRKHGHGDE